MGVRILKWFNMELNIEDQVISVTGVSEAKHAKKHTMRSWYETNPPRKKIFYFRNWTSIDTKLL